jgi:hypothetical protein
MDYTYKLPSKSPYVDPDSPPVCIIRIEDGACIPLNEDNTDYKQYLQWLGEGNTPLPPDEPETV